MGTVLITIQKECSKDEARALAALLKRTIPELRLMASYKEEL